MSDRRRFDKPFDERPWSSLRTGWTRPFLLAILAAYLLLALGYGVANPLFEAPDEHKHFFTVAFIAENGRLPFYDAADPDPWTAQEAAQPPLYYLLASLLINPAETAAARQEVWPNPFARIGDASFPSNTNAFVHGPWEARPWRGYVAAAHRLRALSALLGLGTLLAIYGSGRLVWPARPARALLATALVAFLPQFGFLHGAISNDPLIIALSAAALWQLLRLWIGATLRQATVVAAEDKTRRENAAVLALGVTIGLAALSKNQGIALWGYATAVLLLLAWRRATTWRTALPVAARWLALLWGPVLLLAGPLWARNWTLYGDVTAASQFVTAAGGDRGYSLTAVLAETPGLWLSLFGVFGWFNVRAPEWVYWIWNGIVVFAVAGAIWVAVQRSRGAEGQATAGRRSPAPCDRRPPLPRSLRPQVAAPLLLLAGWVVIVYAALVGFMLQTTAAQGRLLFPALVPLALGMAYGLSAWRRPVPALVVGGALLTTVYCLLVTVPAAYERPPTISLDALPETAVRLDADLGQAIELVAAELHEDDLLPGDFVPLTLYWRAQRPIPVPVDKDDTIDYVIEIFGRDLALIGKLQGYFGRGLSPASLWPPGEVLIERTAVPLAKALAAPTQATVFVKLADSRPAVRVGALKVAPARWPTTDGPALARLGEGIEIVAAAASPQSARPGETVIVDVIWRVTAAPGGDYTTFIHLGESARPPLATGDSAPLGGDYPTRLWAAGEVFADRYPIDLPADLANGRYPVTLGMYDPVSGGRLPLTVDGERAVGDAWVVGWVDVIE